MPSVNPKVIVELRSLESSSPGFLSDLIDLFLKEAEARMAGLRTAFSERDVQAFERAAHTLKGSSGNLGAQSMSRLCEELQTVGRAAEWKRAAELLSALEAEFPQVRSELEAERSRPPPP